MSPRSSVLMLCVLILSGLVVTETVGGRNKKKVGTDRNDADKAALPSVYDFNNDEQVNDGDDDENRNGLDPESKIEGIPIKCLTLGEIYQIADDRDDIDQAKWDIIVMKKLMKERSVQPDVDQGRRKKRWVSGALKALLAAGRALFKGSKPGRVTTKGDRITRQYEKSGNYQDAVKDFDRFKPDNVKEFDGKISGKSGTVGDHKFTVRDGSKNDGPPTLDIQSPREDGSTYTRKFRYKKNE